MSHTENLINQLAALIIQYHDSQIKLDSSLKPCLDNNPSKNDYIDYARQQLALEDYPIYFSNLIAECKPVNKERIDFLTYILNEINIIKSFVINEYEDLETYKNIVFKLLSDLIKLRDTYNNKDCSVTKHQKLNHIETNLKGMTINSSFTYITGKLSTSGMLVDNLLKSFDLKNEKDFKFKANKFCSEIFREQENILLEKKKNKELTDSLNQIGGKLQESENEIIKTNTTIETLQKQLEEKQTACEASQNALLNLKDLHDTLNKNYQDLQQQLSKAMEALEISQSSVQSLEHQHKKDQADYLSNQNTVHLQFKSQINELKVEIKNLESKNKELNTAAGIAAKETTLNEVKNKNLQQAHDSLLLKLGEAQKRVERLENELLSNSSMVSTLNEDINKLKQEHAKQLEKEKLIIISLKEKLNNLQKNVIETNSKESLYPLPFSKNPSKFTFSSILNPSILNKLESNEDKKTSFLNTID